MFKNNTKIVLILFIALLFIQNNVMPMKDNEPGTSEILGGTNRPEIPKLIPDQTTPTEKPKSNAEIAYNLNPKINPEITIENNSILPIYIFFREIDKPNLIKFIYLPGDTLKNDSGPRAKIGNLRNIASLEVSHCQTPYQNKFIVTAINSAQATGNIKASIPDSFLKKIQALIAVIPQEVLNFTSSQPTSFFLNIAKNYFSSFPIDLLNLQIESTENNPANVHVTDIVPGVTSLQYYYGKMGTIAIKALRTTSKATVKGITKAITSSKDVVIKAIIATPKVAKKTKDAIVIYTKIINSIIADFKSGNIWKQMLPDTFTEDFEEAARQSQIQRFGDDPDGLKDIEGTGI